MLHGYQCSPLLHQKHIMGLKSRGEGWNAKCENIFNLNSIKIKQKCNKTKCRLETVYGVSLLFNLCETFHLYIGSEMTAKSK